MNIFPSDFNGKNLQEKEAGCLPKYRAIIYNKFKLTKKKCFHVKLDKDFTQYAYDLLRNELIMRNLSMCIIEKIYHSNGNLAFIKTKFCTDNSDNNYLRITPLIK